MEEAKVALRRKYSQQIFNSTSTLAFNSSASIVSNDNKTHSLTPIDLSSTLRRRSHGSEQLNESLTAWKEREDKQDKDKVGSASDHQSSYKVN